MNEAVSLTTAKPLKLSRTLVCYKSVDHSDVVGASPVGAAQTTSLFSTEHMASVDLGKGKVLQHETRNSWVWGSSVSYIRGLTVYYIGTLALVMYIHHSTGTVTRSLPSRSPHLPTPIPHPHPIADGGNGTVPPYGVLLADMLTVTVEALT